MRCIFFGACLFLLLSCFWLSVSSPVNCGGSSSTQMMTTLEVADEEALALQLETLSSPEDASAQILQNGGSQGCHNSFVCKYHCPCGTLFFYLNSKDSTLMQVNEAVCLGEGTTADKNARAVIMDEALQNSKQVNFTEIIREAVTLALYNVTATRLAIEDTIGKNPEKVPLSSKDIEKGMISHVETSFDTNVLENDEPEVQSASTLWWWNLATLWSDAVKATDNVVHTITTDVNNLVHNVEKTVSTDVNKFDKTATTVINNVENDVKDAASFEEKVVHTVTDDAEIVGKDVYHAVVHDYSNIVDSLAKALGPKWLPVLDAVKADFVATVKIFDQGFDIIISTIGSFTNDILVGESNLVDGVLTKWENLIQNSAANLNKGIQTMLHPRFVAVCEDSVTEQDINEFVNWFREYIKKFYTNFQNLCVKEYGNVDKAIIKMSHEINIAASSQERKLVVRVLETLQGKFGLLFLQTPQGKKAVSEAVVSLNKFLQPVRLAVLEVFLRIYNDKVLTCSCQDMINYAKDHNMLPQAVGFESSILSTCVSQCA